MARSGSVPSPTCASTATRRRAPSTCVTRAGKDVGRADELRHVAADRPVVDFLRRADLADAPLLHDDDAVGDDHRLFLVVGDVDRGDAELRLQPPQFEPHALAQLGVEIAQRLVEQQNLGLVDDGARQRHALLLAAAQHGGRTVDLAFQAHHLEHAPHALLARRPATASCCAGHRRRSAPPSCAATPHRTGTPCRSCGFRARRESPAPDRRRCGRRSRCGRNRWSRSRRWRATSWSCRSRSAPAASGTRRCAARN